MISGKFIAEVNQKKQIQLPPEIVTQLKINNGDKIEVQVKRIRSRRLELKISTNPLVKLIERK